MKPLHAFLLFCAACVMVATYCVPDRPAPPPPPKQPIPFTLSGSWQSGTQTYELKQQGGFVEIRNALWPATGAWDGTTLHVWWRSLDGTLLYGGEFKLIDGELRGGYWAATGGPVHGETWRRK